MNYKAKYKGKYRDVRFCDITYLQYEYRGYTYDVYINHNRGNEPLSWQHKMAQDRIDSIIDMCEAERNNANINKESIDTIINELMIFWEG